ncbi:MAG: sensor histidine kinase [Firmicutes bacterium]|nr:sensor histidine kinase [Bacillota bacterium]
MFFFNTIRNRYKKLKIRTLLVILSSGIVFIFLSFISYICYSTTTSILFDKLQSIEYTNLKQINNSLTAAVNEMKRYTVNMSKNKSLVDLLKKYIQAGNDYMLKINLYEAIKSSFDNSNMYYRGINSVEFYFKDGHVSNTVQAERKDIPVITYNNIIKSNLYSNTLKSKDSVILIEPGYRDEFLGSFNSPCFGSIVYRDNIEIGYLIIVMQSNWFDMLSFNSKTMICDLDMDHLIWSGDIFLTKYYHNIKKLIKHNKGTIVFACDKDRYNISYIKSDINNWTILTFSNISQMFRPVRQVRNYSLMAILISLVVSFILSKYFSFRITKPIYELIEVASRYKVEEKIEFVSIKSAGSNLMVNAMLYFLFIVFIPVLLYSIVTYSISSGIIKDKVQESLYITMNQTVENIDAFIERNERVSTTIMFDKNIQEYLIAKTASLDYDNELYINKLNDVLSEKAAIVNNLFETIIYDSKGKTIFSTIYRTGESMEPELYEKLMKTYGEPFWVNYRSDSNNLNILGLARRVKGIVNDSRYNLKTLGFLFLVYNESTIESLYKDFDINEKDFSIYIIDSLGTIITHKYKSMIGKQVPFNIYDQTTKNWSNIEYENGKPILTIYAKCKKLPWVLVSKIPYDYVSTNNQRILLANIYTILVAFLSAFIISYFFSYFFTKAINKINNDLIRLGEGDTEINFSRNIYINEIKDLAETFNIMARRVRRLIELEKEKKDAEIIALQAQINPHFLYNTLESIKWMNKRGEKDKVDVMITALGDLFRLGISRDKIFIPIIEEVNYAKAYVDIQKVRYQSKLECFWFVEDTVVNCLCPKLILQPLIENSIYHGLQDRDTGGLIKIYIFRSADLIIFKVTDNGIGINSEQLAQIRNNLGDNTGKSIGIYNVQKRINLYFGNDYGLTIDSIPGEGTTVTVSIPIIEVP